MTPARFKAIRHQLGLSQAELARHWGRSEANGARSIRRFENGERDIPVTIADAMECYARHGFPPKHSD